MPGEQHKVMNFYDHSTDSMHFLRRGQRDIRGGVCPFSAHRSKSPFEGSQVINGTVFWRRAPRCLKAELPDHIPLVT